MFETQKIDIFFSGEKNLLDEKEKIFITRRVKLVRFLKLFLPCLTALLLGVGVILFDFETNSDATLSLAEDEKIYFEKFRMKNTIFEITEKDNQLTTLKSVLVEEVSPNSKLYKLSHPWAKILDDGRVVTLSAKLGNYNQNSQQLDVHDEVVINYDEQMTIKTQSAVYNFYTEQGFGNEHIKGHGDKGDFEADRFTLNKKIGEFVLINNVHIKNESFDLKTPKQATLYQNQNKFIAYNATIEHDKKTIKGDTVTVFFKDTKNFEIVKFISNGHTEIYQNGKKAFSDYGEYLEEKKIVNLHKNVRVIDPSGYIATADSGIYNLNDNTFTLVHNVVIRKDDNVVTAPKATYFQNKNEFHFYDDVKITQKDNVITASKAIYFQNKDEFHFYDNVKITQEDNVVTAQKGVYYIKKNSAELNGNVVITKNGNEVRGDKAISDFTTSKSRLIANKGGRVHGKLFENTLKKE